MTDTEPIGATLPLRIAGHTHADVGDQLGHPDPGITRVVLRAELAATRYAHLPESQAVDMLRRDALAAMCDAATTDPDHTPDEQQRAAHRHASTRRELDRLIRRLHRLQPKQADQVQADPGTRWPDR